METDRLRSAFTRHVLSPAVNYHRPCMLAVEETGDDGCVRWHCLHDQVSTPHERLRGLDGAERHLKPGVTFTALDRAAHAASDRTRCAR